MGYGGHKLSMAVMVCRNSQCTMRSASLHLAFSLLKRYANSDDACGRRVFCVLCHATVISRVQDLHFHMPRS